MSATDRKDVNNIEISDICVNPQNVQLAHDDQSDDEQLRSVRHRTLTDKGAEHLEHLIARQLNNLKRDWGEVEINIKLVSDSPDDIATLRNLEKALNKSYGRYREVSIQYMSLLARSNPYDSKQISESHNTTNSIRENAVDGALQHLDERIQSAIELHSSTSKRTRSTRTKTSETSDLVVRKRAAAEAARTSVEFAHKEADIRRHQALLEEQQKVSEAQANRLKLDLDTNLMLLQHEKDVAIADVEVQVLTAHSEDSKSEIKKPNIDLPEEDIKERTQDYVEQLQQGLIHDAYDHNYDHEQVVTNIAGHGDNVPQHVSFAPVRRPTPHGNTNTRLELSSDALYTEHLQTHADVTMGQPPLQYLSPPQIPVAGQDVLRPRMDAQNKPAHIQGYTPLYQGFNNSNIPHAMHGQGKKVHPPQMTRMQVSAPPTTYYTGSPVHIPTNETYTQFIPNGDVNMYGPSIPPQAVNNNVAVDLSQFLLKKELLLSRLTRFNDRPESFAIWKASFRSIMFGLRVTVMEELDLLVKYLGPESSSHAISLRGANVQNPACALKRLWDRLDERYGCPEMVEAALKDKLAKFPKLTNKDNRKLYELSDIVSEIESIMMDEQYRSLLAYYNSSSGVIPIVNKLPYNLQEKWTNQAFSYKSRNNVAFPPFIVFAEFLRTISKIKNDPSFAYDAAPSKPQNNTISDQKWHHPKTTVMSRKTELSRETSTKQRALDVGTHCPVHLTKHPLNECRVFRQKSLEERKELIRKFGICFKCCASNSHQAQACRQAQLCKECDSNRHATALHISQVRPRLQEKEQGGEKIEHCSSIPVTSTCTQICGESFDGKSCAKTMLVRVYPDSKPEEARLVYAIIDDQSNATLAKSDFFNLFGIRQTNQFQYTLKSCAGSISTQGRVASDFIVESLDGANKLELPTLLECDQIPNNRHEIPTPDVAQHHVHLKDIAKYIPPLDEHADILLLVGRDIPEAHHVLDQRIGVPHSPYAQKLHLGWVIVGESCLSKAHRPTVVNVNKTNLMYDGRPSYFVPCPNDIHVKVYHTERNGTDKIFGKNVFQTSKDDMKIGMSREDNDFLDIMDEHLHRNQEGKWEAPLPFKEPRPSLPNNRPQAWKRAQILHKSLMKNPTKQKHFHEFMDKIFNNGHAEPAPPLKEDEECWYLPIFGVYHHQKPNQIRAVFDSSAQFEGVSLNDVLLTGPDLTNNLLGVLLRFRREPIAITADIQQMFYCFAVTEDHRNFLRFLWYQDNDFSNDLVEYRMRVHVFGNSPSPAVATYGLRQAARTNQEHYGQDVTEFVTRNFYVDDGLASFSTVDKAVSLMKRTQEALRVGGNLRLHKITSNSTDVIRSIPSEDRATDLKDLTLGEDDLPSQRSLGLIWDLATDSFTFRVSRQCKPYTRRGVLSTVSSIYDPIGFLSPVIIHGKILLRELMSESVGWDETLPEERHQEWEDWRGSLTLLEQLYIPRTYVTTSLQESNSRELHIFSDASEKAIAAVAYLKVVNDDDTVRVGFVLGKAKVAPSHGHTIPRLELCAAVLALEMTEFILENMDCSVDIVRFYTDSKIVLGYIHNQTRRFYVYVTNRVDRIRRSSSPEQWSYVPTETNPADVGTRSLTAAQIVRDSSWLTGPSFLMNKTEAVISSFPLLQTDVELRPVKAMKTDIKQHPSLGSHRFERFSIWRRLVEIIAQLQHIAQSFHNNAFHHGWHICFLSQNVEAYEQAEQFIIKLVQREEYPEEFSCIRNNEPLHKKSSLLMLDPKIDNDGLLRVGGRLDRSDYGLGFKNPIIIPGHHHIATLLVRHHHVIVKHQGRHITDGAVRAAGLWITGVKRLISSLIHRCVMCRKLRGKHMNQKMSDLPPDRLTPNPPFTYVGVDTFGPWFIVTRRTRGGQANSKRWALLFTCLTTRAIHIEVIEDMSSSAFINALRRFVSVRGKVKIFRSDRGTNFTGSTESLQIEAINVEDGNIKDFLYKKGTIWLFNPPHSSHMGGVWERMIGVTRRILDSIMTGVTATRLTHEVLTTFMAEVSAIVNSRPILPVSTDSEDPFVLSPATLLTQKTDHVTAQLQNVDIRDIYKAQWKQTQVLAEAFWKKWRQQYLQSLQVRRKWQNDQPPNKVGDIVLLKQESPRNEWPLGRIVEVLPGTDNRVRKVIVCVTKDGMLSSYTRPITEIVLLVSSE